MEPPIWQTKKQMCEIGRRIWQRGYCAGNEGNHTVRVSEDQVLCTPTGLSKGFLDPEEICVVDMDGRQIEPNTKQRKPSSEIRLHLGIYQHRSDVRAVVHSHPPHATAFAIANIPLPEGIHPEAEVFLGRVPMAKFAMPSTAKLPESVVELVGPQTNTVLLGNHGSVSFSHGLLDAYYKLEILDNYCRILLLCQQLGQANVLDNEQIHGLLNIKKKFGLADDRLQCSLDGCVGEQNQQFFATFDVRPTTATCSCNGEKVQTTQTEVEQAGPTGNSDMDALVTAITDQILDRI